MRFKFNSLQGEGIRDVPIKIYLYSNPSAINDGFGSNKGNEIPEPKYKWLPDIDKLRLLNIFSNSHLYFGSGISFPLFDPNPSLIADGLEYK